MTSKALINLYSEQLDILAKKGHFIDCNDDEFNDSIDEQHVSAIYQFRTIRIGEILSCNFNVIGSICSKLHFIHIKLAFQYTLNVSGVQFIWQTLICSRKLVEIDAIDLCYSVVLLIKLICVHFLFCAIFAKLCNCIELIKYVPNLSSNNI